MQKEIFYSRSFLKSYKKRFAHNKKVKNQIKMRIDKFIVDRNDPLLRDHKLLGIKRGERSFSITGDIRVVYIEIEDRFIFIDIGTHSQVH